MSLILHIETATDVCSVCLSNKDELINHLNSSESFVHTRQATLMIQKLFDQSDFSIYDLNAVSISKGPGSYTGLRVGTSIAKGMCFGLDIPLIAVKTLKSIASAAISEESDNSHCAYIPMIDARRMEVYHSVYAYSLQELLADEPKILDDSSFQELVPKYEKIIFCGNGADKFMELVSHPQFVFRKVICDARHLLPLAYKKYQNGEFERLSTFVPNYIKPANVTKSKKKLI